MKSDGYYFLFIIWHTTNTYFSSILRKNTRKIGFHSTSEQWGSWISNSKDASTIFKWVYIVDRIGQYLCGARMNGVLIEWILLMGFCIILMDSRTCGLDNFYNFNFYYLYVFLFFTRTYMSHSLYIQTICIPSNKMCIHLIYIMYCCGDTSNLDKKLDRIK
jgi:hypothetical protein